MDTERQQPPILMTKVEVKRLGMTLLSETRTHQDDFGHGGVANSHTVTKSTVVDAFNDSSMNKHSRTLPSH
jgi:hypothetical protein